MFNKQCEWKERRFSFSFAGEYCAFSRSCVYSGILEAGVRLWRRASANGNIDTPLVSQWKHGHSTPVSQWPQSSNQQRLNVDMVEESGYMKLKYHYDSSDWITYIICCLGPDPGVRPLHRVDWLVWHCDMKQLLLDGYKTTNEHWRGTNDKPISATGGTNAECQNQRGIIMVTALDKTEAAIWAVLSLHFVLKHSAPLLKLWQNHCVGMAMPLVWT